MCKKKDPKSSKIIFSAVRNITHFIGAEHIASMATLKYKCQDVGSVKKTETIDKCGTH